MHTFFRPLNNEMTLNTTYYYKHYTYNIIYMTLPTICMYEKVEIPKIDVMRLQIAL